MDLKTVLTIISTIISILSLLGLGTIMSLFWKDRHSKREEELKKLLDYQNEQLDKQIRSTIAEELDKKLAPYDGAVKQFSDDISWLKKGVQATCRSDLQDMVLKAEKEGYSSEDDKQRWVKTYAAYHNLGENGAMDARNDWYLTLPSTKIKKERQKLNETTKTKK